jgi:hypothetical protein
LLFACVCVFVLVLGWVGGTNRCFVWWRLR